MREAQTKWQKDKFCIEKDDIAIEDALELYTKGKVAVEECKNKIDMIEKEVKKINPDGSVSSFDEVDF